MINLIFNNATVMVMGYNKANVYRHIHLFDACYELIKIENGSYKIGKPCVTADIFYKEDTISFDHGILLKGDKTPEYEIKDNGSCKIMVISYKDIEHNFADDTFSVNFDSVYQGENAHFINKKYTWVDLAFINVFCSALKIPCPFKIYRPSCSIYSIYNLERYVYLIKSKTIPEFNKLIDDGFFDFAFKISKNSDFTVKKQIKKFQGVSHKKNYSDIPDCILKAVGGDVLKAFELINSHINNEERLKKYKRICNFSEYQIGVFGYVIKILLKVNNNDFEKCFDIVLNLNNDKRGFERLDAICRFGNCFESAVYLPENWINEYISEMKEWDDLGRYNWEFCSKYFLRFCNPKLETFYKSSIGKKILEEFSDGFGSCTRTCVTSSIYNNFELRSLSDNNFCFIPLFQKDNNEFLITVFYDFNSKKVEVQYYNIREGVTSHVFEFSDGKIALNSKNTNNKILSGLIPLFSELQIDLLNEAIQSLYNNHIMRALV